MDDKQKAMFVGSLRLGIGAGLLAAPGFAGRIWVGPDADGHGTKVFARAIGARDALLGLRTLQAAQTGEPVKHWLKLGFVADAADAAATVVAFRNLTPARRLLVPLVAGAVAAIGYTAAAVLD